MERRERPPIPGSTPSKLIGEKSPYANPSKQFQNQPYLTPTTTATNTANNATSTGGVASGALHPGTGSIHSHSHHSRHSHSGGPKMSNAHILQNNNIYNNDCDSSIISNMSEISRSEKSVLTERSTGTLKILKKSINTLPYELRESVGSAVDLVIQQSELLRSDLENSKLDVAFLRSDLKKRNQEIEQLKQHCETFQRKNTDLENTLKDMGDNLELRQHSLVKNRKCINRMAGTNRM
jgi:hypothetical protein